MNNLEPIKRKLSSETMCMCGCMKDGTIITMGPGVLQCRVEVRGMTQRRVCETISFAKSTKHMVPEK